MSQVKSFTIGGVTYNAAMAVAVDQDKLLSLLTAPVMDRALGAAKLGQDLDNSILVPMFMAMPSALKAQVASILTCRVVIHGQNTPITVEDFGGRMVQYNTLLGELLRWNLSDFFDWLPGVLNDDRAENPQSPAP